jgi:hypothetical protein
MNMTKGQVKLSKAGKCWDLEIIAASEAPIIATGGQAYSTDEIICKLRQLITAGSISETTSVTMMIHGRVIPGFESVRDLFAYRYEFEIITDES